MFLVKAGILPAIEGRWSRLNESFSNHVMLSGMISEAVLEVPGDDGQSSMKSELGGGDHANPVLPFRSDRRTMGAGGAAHPSSEIRRPSTYNGRACCIRRNHLSAAHGLPMGAASQGFSPLADRSTA